MTANPTRAIDELNHRFFVDHPVDAARKIEDLPILDVVEATKRQPAKVLMPVWRNLLPETVAKLLRALPDELADELLAEMPPQHSVRSLGFMSEENVQKHLSRLDTSLRKDIETLMSYPNDTAGRLMNTKVSTFRRDMTAGAALEMLREGGLKTARSLFLIDEDQRLTGKASLTDVALANSEVTLDQLEQPILAVVRPVDSLSEVTQIFEKGNILDLPVVDLDGILLGAVTHDDIAQTVRTDATIDLQTMVGASREERALSSPLFTVRKRMPLASDKFANRVHGGRRGRCL